MDKTDAPVDNPFYDKKVVFTGDLLEWDRSAAACLLQKLGADVNTSISGRTQIVVIGKGAGPSKLEKIIDILADGAPLRLMNERIFNKEVQPYLSFVGINT
jgi:DNA polymerase-3 subunit epsilon